MPSLISHMFGIIHTSSLMKMCSTQDCIQDWQYDTKFESLFLVKKKLHSL